MAKEANAIENAERELKYHEFRMKQEWRKVENRVALMELRLERAKEVRDQYIDYLQVKYPQWKPNFKTFQRQVTFVQPTAKNLIQELATAKYHFVDEKPALNLAQALQTSKLAPKSQIPSSNSILLKSDLDVMKRRLNEISNDLQSLRESRLALSRTDLSTQSRDRIHLPTRDDEFLQRTSPAAAAFESSFENRNRSMSQPPPTRLAEATNRTDSKIIHRETADLLDQSKVGGNDVPLTQAEDESDEEPTRLIRSERFQQELQEVKELLTKERQLIEPTSDDKAPASTVETTAPRRARFDFSSNSSETVPAAVVQEQNVHEPAVNKDKEIAPQIENRAAVEKAPIAPAPQAPQALRAPAPEPASVPIFTQPIIPQSNPVKSEAPSASYQQMLGLISYTADTKDESSETDSLEERLAIGKRKTVARPQPAVQEQKITPTVSENSQPKSEKKPADEFLAKLFPDRKANVATSVQTRKILFSGNSSSDESVDLKGKGGNDSDSDFFG
uniref:Uncharacterized protein n=1 Tax=Plectus sambesii TaxID=2011161 RepID=A0A914WPL5_9BILA